MRQKTTICILGDICPAWGFRPQFDQGDARAIFGDVLDALQNADIAAANLESPASRRGAPLIKNRKCICSKPEDLRVLKKAGLDILSLANNHIYDYGHTGLIDTLDAAEENQLSIVGAGFSQEEASKPIIIQRNGWTIGLFAFAEQEFNTDPATGAGAALFDPYSSLWEIKKTKECCDAVIVLFHGGVEHYELPSPLLQKKCRAIADAGADCILCQHSHCIGTHENYNGCEILYGQGNAVFGKGRGKRWNTGLLTTIELEEAGRRVHYRAFEAGETGIRFLNASDNAKRLTAFDALSENISDIGFLKSKWTQYCEGRTKESIPLLLGWRRWKRALNRLTKNWLVRRFLAKGNTGAMLNLIRCDSHREVLQTIFDDSIAQ